MADAAATESEIWPELPYESWKDTYETLHLWTQIVGKIRLSLTPWLNHSWQVPLYLSARGLSTSPIYIGTRALELSFDFIDHVLRIETSDGAEARLALRPRPVADFYAALLAELEALHLPVRIHPVPNEIANPIPFDRDRQHAAYDAEAARRCWRVLLQADRVFKHFRTGFLGKTSPVHFFWGSFDLAVTRFSGRRAPAHPGGVPHLPLAVAREAYSHEVSSVGFWPGGAALPEPVFYAYAYPEPPGFRDAALRPTAARYSPEFGEFVLPYSVVRAAPDPDRTLLDFLQSTYEAAADKAGWDRAGLECAIGMPGVPRQVESP